MTLSAPKRCSSIAEELGEPMAGTVDTRPRWLLVEDASAWGSHAVRDVLGASFEAAAKDAGLRPLLIRRREGPPKADAVRRVFVIDTVSRLIVTREIGHVDELRVEDLVGPPLATMGEPVPGPLFLVCTNGKRDACCALRGRVTLAALAADHAAASWECTHLGGHRFAGNLVCLPDGIVYGRVSPDAAPRLAAEFREGRLDLDHLRGRSMLPASTQVAEIELRRMLGLDGLRDLELVEADEGEEEASATFRTADGRTHRLELRPERLAPPRAISCGATELEEPLHWRVVA